MDLKKIKFLLDENIDYRLHKLFHKYELSFIAMQKLDWSGMRNGELSIKMKKEKYDVLITRDKDFTFLWKKHKISVIYLKVKPLTLTNLLLRLDYLFNNWFDNITSPFLIELHLKSMKSEVL